MNVNLRNSNTTPTTTHAQHSPNLIGPPATLYLMRLRNLENLSVPLGPCITARSGCSSELEVPTAHFASGNDALRRFQIFEACGGFDWLADSTDRRDEGLRICWSLSIMWASIVTNRSRKHASERCPPRAHISHEGHFGQFFCIPYSFLHCYSGSAL
jgi:hypothetical protein